MIGNALKPKQDGNMDTKTRTLVCDSHNFGGWRVKSFLVLTRVSIRMQKYEDAIHILDSAHVVSAKYSTSDYPQQTLPKASTGCLLSPEEEYRISIYLDKEFKELEQSEGRQVTHESMESSPCTSIDNDETDDGPQPVSVEQSCFIKRISSSLLGESLPKRTKKEKLAHDVLDSSSLATDNEDEDEDKYSDHQEISQVWPSTVKEPEMPPKGLDGKGPVEVLDPELILSVSRSASHNSLMSDCPSLGSTTSFEDSSFSLDGEITYYRGGTSMSPGSPGGLVKRVSFYPSPPHVRLYRRYDIERRELSSPDNGSIIQFHQLQQETQNAEKESRRAK